MVRDASMCNVSVRDGSLCGVAGCVMYCFLCIGV